MPATSLQARSPSSISGKARYPGAWRLGEGGAENGPNFLIATDFSEPRAQASLHPQVSTLMEQTTCCPFTHPESPSSTRDPLQALGTPLARRASWGNGPSSSIWPPSCSLASLQRRPPHSGATPPGFLRGGEPLTSLLTPHPLRGALLPPAAQVLSDVRHLYTRWSQATRCPTDGCPLSSQVQRRGQSRALTHLCRHSQTHSPGPSKPRETEQDVTARARTLHP